MSCSEAASCIIASTWVVNDVSCSGDKTGVVLMVGVVTTGCPAITITDCLFASLMRNVPALVNVTLVRSAGSISLSASAVTETIAFDWLGSKTIG